MRRIEGQPQEPRTVPLGVYPFNGIIDVVRSGVNVGVGCLAIYRLGPGEVVIDVTHRAREMRVPCEIGCAVPTLIVTGQVPLADGRVLISERCVQIQHLRDDSLGESEVVRTFLVHRRADAGPKAVAARLYRRSRGGTDRVRIDISKQNPGLPQHVDGGGRWKGVAFTVTFEHVHSKIVGEDEHDVAADGTA